MRFFQSRVAFLGLFLLVGLRPLAVFAQPATASSEPAKLPEARVDHDGLKKLSWQLLIQSSALGDLTVYETIDRLHAMVVHHIDLVEGQPISPEHRDVVIDLNLPADQAAALLAKVQAVHMDFVTLSVTDPMTTEAECRRVLDLAKQLKVKRVVCQPTGDAMGTLDKLADEYRVGVSIVNRATAGLYREPAAILAALQGHSARISVCADIAEFRRAGVVPLEAVQKLTGHLLDVRLSDVDAQGAIVGIGSGTVDAAAILAEIKSQNFKGALTLGTVTPGAVDPAQSIAPFIDSLNAFSDMVRKLASGD